MGFLSKLIRAIDYFLDSIRNFFSILKLRIKYPSIAITGNTFIEKACKIVCEDGGKLVLDNAYIATGTTIRASKDSEIIIQDSSVGKGCMIISISRIEIKSNCSIAEMVVIRDQDHVHNLTSENMSNQGFNSAPITIGSNVWIGCKATILKGVNIGSNSVVGAHSLVNKNLPSSSLSFGIPAIIKKTNN